MNSAVRDIYSGEVLSGGTVHNGGTVQRALAKSMALKAESISVQELRYLGSSASSASSVSSASSAFSASSNGLDESCHLCMTDGWG